MYFAGKNLLYTFHQSLTAQHVTVGLFKRYARSPENRTFKNYFRKTNPFTIYMRQRPENALNRYITKHRRKKNPVLTNFTNRIVTTTMETLQNLRQSYPAPTGHDSAGVPSEPGPLGRAKVNRPCGASAERTEMPVMSASAYSSRLRSHASGLKIQNKPILVERGHSRAVSSWGLQSGAGCV